MPSLFTLLFKSYGAEILLVTAVVAFLALLPSLYRLIKRQWRIYSCLRRLPSDHTDTHWLMGHSLLIIKKLYSGDMLDYFAKFSQIGKVTVLTLGPFFKLVLCNHPDTFKWSLGQNPKADFAYYPLRPWLGVSLLTSNGKKWARTRRLLTPAFHFDILKPYISVYENCSQELVNDWKKRALSNEAFDVFHSISLLTLDVMLRCTCSFKSNCQTEKTHSPYVAAVSELSSLAMERIFFSPAYYDWIYALMPSKRRYSRACKLVHKFSMDVIRERKKALKELQDKGETDPLISLKGKKRKYLDFIDILLEARDESGVGLTDEEIRAEVDTFMFGGHDTTASGITWALYNLARYPEHQIKCREEVDAAFEKEGDHLTWEAVKGFKYLKYCLKESLRLFPPAPIISRTLTEDCNFEGHTIPEGSWVSTNIYAAHHHPDIWEEPETFNPLRFAEGAPARHSHSFVAFSAGPRNCIGQDFALNEEKVIIAHILRNFEVSLPDDDRRNVVMRYMIIIRPKDGLYLHLKLREM